jgi:hypothetical protein
MMGGEIVKGDLAYEGRVILYIIKGKEPYRLCADIS